MLILSWLLVGFILFSVSCGVYDDYLAYQYQYYKDDWIVDGRRRGFNFNPLRSRYFVRFFNHLSNKNIPCWAASDKAAQKRFKRMVLMNRIWIVYLVLTVPMMMFEMFA